MLVTMETTQRFYFYGCDPLRNVIFVADFMPDTFQSICLLRPLGLRTTSSLGAESELQISYATALQRYSSLKCIALFQAFGSALADFLYLSLRLQTRCLELLKLILETLDVQLLHLLALHS